MIDLHQHRAQRRNIIMIKSELLLHHLEHAVLQWSPPVLILDQDEVVLRALDVEHVRVLRDVGVRVGVLGQLVDLVLCYCDCVLVVEAGQVYVLQRLVLLVYFVEDLPGDIVFYSLAHHFELVAVLILEVLALLKTERVVLVVELLVQSLLALLHQLVELLVVFHAKAHLLVLLLDGNT